MEYRLGADPERHGATDCLHLTRAVLLWQGIAVPAPERSWYRRLRRGDTSVFPEELERWGKQVAAPKLSGTVALCRSEAGYGLAVFWEEGFLHCLIHQVRWSPVSQLQVTALYCPSR
jgi:hypothetical protein